MFTLLSPRFAENRGKICRKSAQIFRNFPGGTLLGLFGDFRGNFSVPQPENGVNFPEFFAKMSENGQKRKKNVTKNTVSALQVRREKITLRENVHFFSFFDHYFFFRNLGPFKKLKTHFKKREKSWPTSRLPL
tara:strand:- start:58 stop:456 length:399 start_codon:yes stop_codon:yes gene_type:complete